MAILLNKKDIEEYLNHEVLNNTIAKNSSYNLFDQARRIISDKSNTGYNSVLDSFENLVYLLPSMSLKNEAKMKGFYLDTKHPYIPYLSSFVCFYLRIINPSEELEKHLTEIDHKIERTFFWERNEANSNLELLNYLQKKSSNLLS